MTYAFIGLIIAIMGFAVWVSRMAARSARVAAENEHLKETMSELGKLVANRILAEEEHAKTDSDAGDFSDPGFWSSIKRRLRLSEDNGTKAENAPIPDNPAPSKDSP